MSRKLFILPCLAVGGLIFTAGEAFAQTQDDTGIVRITDQSPTALASHSTCTTCQSGYQSGMGGYIDAGGCPYGCPPGYCQHGGCGQGQICWKVHQFLDWFNPYGACTFSPDHGWSVPGKRPIYHPSVTYRKMFPDAWTGAPSGPQTRAPMAYMPTDTTQLGFYYQHAPRWRPVRGMIPATPHPAEWHVPKCVIDEGGLCQEMGVCQGTVMHGNVIDGGTVIDSGTVIQAPSKLSEPKPATPDVPSSAPDEVPPPPTTTSAAGLEPTDRTPILHRIAQ